jgi:CHRD domain-containing protein
MLSRKLFTAAIVAGLIGVGAPGQAHDGPGGEHGGSATPSSSGKAVYLTAELNGANEVPTPGGPAVGDPNGHAQAFVKIQGNQVSFGLKWRGIAAPTAGHIHAGAAGANGPVSVGFFGQALAPSVRAAVGTVTVADAAVIESIKTNPGAFYANIHTAEFPGGAVRGQFEKAKPFDVESVLTLNSTLEANADAAQEVQVPGGPLVGDADGRARWELKQTSHKLRYSTTWKRIAAPTAGHVHQARAGANGSVVVDVFGALPASFSGVAGSVPAVSRQVMKGLSNNPARFYTNIHTAEFPGGAVRGQLSAAH